MKLGVNTHYSQGFSQATLATAASLGAASIRDGASQVTSPVGGPVSKTDFLTKAANLGLGDTAVFTNTEGLFGAQRLPLTDIERQAFANNIVAQLQLHPGQIQQIEVWNEFNGPNTNLPSGADLAQTYAALLKTVYQTVKPLFPDVKILGASVNVIGVGLIDQTLKAGAGAYMDGIVVHPYQPSAENLDQEIAHLQAVVAADGKPIPIYATEFGGQFNDADDAPAYMMKAVTEMASVHVAEADWYGLQDEPWFSNVGLVDGAGNLKPAASTFSFIEHQLLPLGDPVKVATGDDLTRVYKYGADTYVIWGEPRGIGFGPGGSFYDTLGNPIAAPTSIGESPIVVKGTSFTLGAPAVIADSLMQFGGAGWTYWAQTGAGKPVQAQLRDSNWNSAYTAIDPNVLSITQNGVTPAQGGSGASINAIERYTATAANRVQVTGTWSPSANSTNGVDLHVRLDGSEIYSTIVTSTFTLAGLYVDLQPGDTLEFVVGTNGSYVGDGTAARIQLLDAASTTIPGGTPIYSAPSVGTAGPDTLRAGDAGTTLQGLAGDDHLYGGKGDDVLMGGSGANVLDGGGGVNTVSYADATAAIQVNLSIATSQTINAATRDKLVSISDAIGSGFDDKITGGAGDNRLHGGAGNDTLVVSAGHDLLDGGAGVDTATWAGAAHGVAVSLAVTGAQDLGGGDTVQLLDIETIIGSRYADTLSGDARDNTLQGGLGNDALNGGGGNDTLIGNAGADTLAGGAGADVFRFLLPGDSTAAALDQVLDFSEADGDRIDLAAIDANTKVAGDQAFAVVAAFDRHPGQLVITQASDHWTVQGDVNGDRVADFCLNVFATGGFGTADMVL